MIRTIAVSLLLCAAFVQAQETPEVKATLAPGQKVSVKGSVGPVLSAEQKLKLRDLQVTAMAAQADYNAYMVSIQQQLDKIAEYAQKKAALENSARAYSAAVKDTLVAVKCEDCVMDNNQVLERPATVQHDKGVTASNKLPPGKPIDAPSKP